MDVEDLIPTFNVNTYRDSLIPPIIGWMIYEVLWFIFSLVDRFILDSKNLGRSASYGFSNEIILLFGIWAGISMARNGCNIGDVLVGGFLVGLAAWIVWFILFPLVNPGDIFAFDNTKLGELNFKEGMLPQFWRLVLLQIGSGLTIVGN